MPHGYPMFITEEERAAEPSTWELIRADYFAYCRRRWPDGTLESRRRRMLLAIPRHIVNPSLRAVVLVRLANGSPPWLWWFWRNLLHSFPIEIWYRSKIGPGFLLPHPFGVAIGANSRIGSNVTLGQNVTFGKGISASGGLPAVGDDVVILSGTVIAGSCEIGAGSLIGANALVVDDVPPNSVVKSPTSRAD